MNAKTFDSLHFLHKHPIWRCLALVALIVSMWAVPHSVGQEKAVDSQIDSDNYIDAVTRQFAASLKSMNYPFINEENLPAFKSNLASYLKERIRKRPLEESASAAAIGIKEWFEELPQNESPYLYFRKDYDSLRWRLWVLAERSELTEQQTETRAIQRAWMREFILKIPGDSETPRKIAEQRIDELTNLEDAFDESMHPFFHYPMNEDEFDIFKNRMLDRESRLSFASSDIFSTIVFARKDRVLERWPVGFKAVGTWVSGMNYFQFLGSASSRSDRFQISDSKDATRYYDIATDRDFSLPAKMSDAQKSDWMQMHGKGDLRLDSKSKKLIPCRGAKMAVLDNSNWWEIDRMSQVDLQEIVDSSSIESYLLADQQFSGDLDDLSGSSELTFDINIDDDETNGPPTLVLRNTDGMLVVIQVLNNWGDSVDLQIRPRPLGPYPPFHNGEPRIEDDDPDLRKELERAGMHFVLKDSVVTGVSLKQNVATLENCESLAKFARLRSVNLQKSESGLSTGLFSALDKLKSLRSLFLDEPKFSEKSLQEFKKFGFTSKLRTLRGTIDSRTLQSLSAFDSLRIVCVALSDNPDEIDFAKLPPNLESLEIHNSGAPTFKNVNALKELQRLSTVITTPSD